MASTDSKDSGPNSAGSPPPGKPDGDSLFTKATELVTEYVEVRGPVLERLDFGQRYEKQSVLGVGGMGSVDLAVDRQIGRKVAMKVILPERAMDDSMRTRFVREARVQGQLEHPSLVPVYDVGVDPDGAVYFTMKRVHGVTLEDILSALRKHSETTRRTYSRRRLLNAFCNVCLAVDFAHQHGVLHRDLKPANVMLGDFGEVYLLDWGLAKVIREPGDSAPDLKSGPDHGEMTAPGALVGTLGYMSPEQVKSQTTALRPTSDVYGLGAILFEILALTELHPRTSTRDLIASTMYGVEARPSVRAPDQDVPPELDQICAKAVAVEIEQRYQTARELQEAVQRYLDGERDQELRRQMASKHAEAASQALARTRSGGTSAIEDRRAAMREIGRALALDPSNELAFKTMVDVFTEPMKEVPEEVHRQMDEQKTAQAGWMGKIAGIAYFSLVLYIPLLLWAGIRNLAALGVFYGLSVICGALSVYVFVRPRAKDRVTFLVMVLSTVLFASTTMFFGPLIMMPAMVAVNTGAFMLYFEGWPRRVGLALGCMAILVPVVLEVSGVLSVSYAFSEAGMLVRPNAIGLEPSSTIILLLVAAVGTVLTSALSITGVRDVLTETQKRLFMQTWHIRQLLPTSVSEPNRASGGRPAAGK